MLNDLHVQWKLGILSAVFLIPIALLTWLLAVDLTDDIAFSAKEIQGQRYVSVLRGAAVRLAAGDGTGAARLVPAIRAIDAEVGAQMDLGDRVSALEARLTRGGAGADALDAVAGVIARVGDGSNLILDPDLDSYYTMSLFIMKLPQALVQTAAAAEQARLRGGAGAATQAPLQAKLVELRAMAQGIEADLAGAYRGNRDGSLRAAFGPAFQRLQQQLTAFLAAGEAVAAGHGADAAGIEPARRQLVAQFDHSWTLVGTELRRLLQARVDDKQRRLALSLGLTALALALASLLAWWIGRSISRPVASLAGQMSAMADGDLSQRIDAQLRRDEIGLLINAAQRMQSRLHALTRDVSDSAAAVEHSAHTVNQAVDAQAARAQQVSATVLEITATMEQLSSSSTQIADHTRAVVDIANQTWENSKRGAEAMAVLRTKIDEIRADNQSSLAEISALDAKSREISKVMLIINTLAAQTKLIAFNAALEASSAGEAGRRFSVVAAEIRRLADSVTDSTADIERQISQIQDGINRLVLTSEHGTAGIDEGMHATVGTAQRLDELVQAARQTSAAAEQISLSTQQQKGASGQVVQALHEIADATRHSAASVEEIARISSTMTATSLDLRTAVDQFTLVAPVPGARPRGEPR